MDRRLLSVAGAASLEGVGQIDEAAARASKIVPMGEQFGAGGAVGGFR